MRERAESASLPSRLLRKPARQIYATAGSEEKRAYLRSLGIAGVFDSRSLEFAHELRTATGGKGVDVVLNSLTGRFHRCRYRNSRPGRAFRGTGRCRASFAGVGKSHSSRYFLSHSPTGGGDRSGERSGSRPHCRPGRAVCKPACSSRCRAKSFPGTGPRCVPLYGAGAAYRKSDRLPRAQRPRRGDPPRWRLSCDRRNLGAWPEGCRMAQRARSR